MILIVKEKFDAAHKLDSVELDHKCRNLHGHSWQVVVGIKVSTNMEYDFLQIKDMLKNILPDHRFLNDFLNIEPTVENICHWLKDQLKFKIKNLAFIEVWETENCGARLEI